MSSIVTCKVSRITALTKQRGHVADVVAEEQFSQYQAVSQYSAKFAAELGTPLRVAAFTAPAVGAE